MRAERPETGQWSRGQCSTMHWSLCLDTRCNDYMQCAMMVRISRMFVCLERDLAVDNDGPIIVDNDDVYLERNDDEYLCFTMLSCLFHEISALRQ